MCNLKSVYGVCSAVVLSAATLTIMGGTLYAEDSSGKNHPATSPAPEQSEITGVVRPNYLPSSLGGMKWPADPKEKSPKFDASVVVQVDGDPNASQMSMPVVAILTTSAIIEKAAKSALQLDQANVRAALDVIATSAGPRMTRLEVRLYEVPAHPWAAGDAEKLILALTQGLRHALNQSTHAQMAIREKTIKQSEMEAKQAELKLADLRKQQAEIRDRLNELPAKYRNGAMHTLPSGQLPNVEEQLNQAKEQLAQRENSNPLLNGLEQVVKLLETQLEQFKSTERPAPEIQSAEIQLAEARAKLEMARGGAERYGRSEYAETVRLKSRVESLQKQYDELKAIVAKVESPEYQKLFDKQKQLSMLEQTMQHDAAVYGSRNEQIRRQMQSPSHYVVTILDGTP